MNNFEKIHIGNADEFGNQIYDLMNEGYLVLCVYKKDNKIYCVESYGYDSSKNDNIYFENYEPCEYSMISENGDCFVDTKFESFDFIPVYSFKELMIRDARMIQKQEGENLCEIYKTKSNKRSAKAAWGLGGVFCDDWANEFGWAQEVEEVEEEDTQEVKQDEEQEVEEIVITIDNVLERLNESLALCVWTSNGTYLFVKVLDKILVKCLQEDFIPFLKEDFLNVRIWIIKEPYGDSDTLDCFKLRMYSIESISKFSNRIFEDKKYAKELFDVLSIVICCLPQQHIWRKLHFNTECPVSRRNYEFLCQHWKEFRYLSRQELRRFVEDSLKDVQNFDSALLNDIFPWIYEFIIE